MALFEVSDLAVTLHTGSRARGRQVVPAVRSFSFSVDRGQTLVFQGRVHSQLNSHAGQFALEPRRATPGDKGRGKK